MASLVEPTPEATPEATPTATTEATDRNSGGLHQDGNVTLDLTNATPVMTVRQVHSTSSITMTTTPEEKTSKTASSVFSGDHWPSEAEQYLMGAKIGSGAFAVVHHAKRKADGKDCAGKLSSKLHSHIHSPLTNIHPFLASLVLFLFGGFS